MTNTAFQKSDTTKDKPDKVTGAVMISVVVPMYNEEESISEFFIRLMPVMDGLGLEYEIICVDDGSKDATWSLVKKHQSENPSVRPLRLSRNFGKEIAITAGLDSARGEAVVFIDADLQDPPELITEFISLWRSGYQNVYGLRIKRDEDTRVKRSTASLFYRLFNMLSDIPIPANAGDFRLLGRDAVKAVRACREQRRFMKGLYAWVGFASIAVPYERPARFAGKSKFGAFKLWNFALEGITSYSTVLLRIWTYIGLLVISIAFILSAWVVYQYFVSDRNPPGFYLTLIVILGFSSLNFTMLGVMGEYIGRIYEEVKGRPLYFLRDDDIDH